MNLQQLIQVMNNPQIKTLMNSSNPQQVALGMIKNSPNANTEIGRNIIRMIERGDMNEIEQYGKNLMKSQGINPNDIFNMINNMPK